MRHLSKRIVLATLAGFIVGTLWLVIFRFITFKSENIHYHASFALYINDKQENFDSFMFYEEVQSCVGDELNNPKARVHMHDKKNHVIHVHDSGATWGHFFANLGYALGNDVLKTDTGTYEDGQNGQELSFILNDKETNTLSNKVITSEDRLLINYGKSSKEVLKKRYEAIKADAAEYNSRNDPSTCASSKELTFGERLKHAIGL